MSTSPTTTTNFSSLPIPPRLTPTPSPPQTPRSTPSTPPIPTTPPLQKSIYPHPHNPTWHVTVTPYSPLWPHQFTQIKDHLHTLFTNTSTPYTAIEHIGSTAIPNLPAKPNIDVLITFARQEDLALAVEALNWEVPRTPPFARYTQVMPRGGGIPGRESFKLYLWPENPYYAVTPERSVYLIAEEEGNEAGIVQVRCYRTVRDVLLEAENRDLLEEYGEVKVGLGREVFWDPLEYSARKDGVVRKILVRGGWTEGEVTRKEELSRRVYVAEEWEGAY